MMKIIFGKSMKKRDVKKKDYVFLDVKMNEKKSPASNLTGV